LVVTCGHVLVEGDVLEHQGALREPERLRHSIDEHGFGETGGLVLVAESAKQHVEFIVVFPRQDAEGSGEAVAEIVHRGDGFSGGGSGAGAVLGVGLIGCDLGGGTKFHGSPQK
jgi:hypothetical protein